MKIQEILDMQTTSAEMRSLIDRARTLPMESLAGIMAADEAAVLAVVMELHANGADYEPSSSIAQLLLSLLVKYEGLAAA